MTQILVTGASGFVGQALCDELYKRDFQVRGALRTLLADLPEHGQYLVPALDEHTDWSAALRGVGIVIHLAARVHVMQDNSSNPLEEFRTVNVKGTENLARQSVQAGVKRLVYVSSIKVNGEETVVERYSEKSAPHPQDPYGISKWEAEQALHRIALETGLEIVIVRLPLAYGSGVKGNFIQMLSVLAKGIPLPLATVRNLRSFIYVENLVDVLITCATHPVAAGKTYLVSDGEDISTPELLRELGAGMGRPARLLPCPPRLLEVAGAMVGKSAQVQRLLGSLQVDSGKIRRELNWTPPYSLQQGLQATAEWYRDSHL